jgi:histidine ammonia-lyase
MVEIELNSSNDNPIIDAEGEHVMHGGHFYGGHIAFAMDSLKVAVANVADLVDRQLAQLMDPKFNHGLPANLSGADEATRSINHGFKAVQIACSAWTAEALKGTMPASVFSRSTECHNQDKVSMGTIAARDCQRLLTLTEQVLAAGMLAAWQGIQLRLKAGELMLGDLQAPVQDCLAQTSEIFDFLEEDRELDGDLHTAVARIRSKYWGLYEKSIC